MPWGMLPDMILFWRAKLLRLIDRLEMETCKSPSSLLNPTCTICSWEQLVKATRNSRSPAEKLSKEFSVRLNLYKYHNFAKLRGILPVRLLSSMPRYWRVEIFPSIDGMAHVRKLFPIAHRSRFGSKLPKSGLRFQEK